MKTIPKFIIIGAMKCGTTSLYRYLTTHPQVLPATKKEIHFFDINFDKGVDWYLQHFEVQLESNYITGEGTVAYLYHASVPQRLCSVFPKTKLIVLFRNPVERTISDYYMRLKNKKEYLSLAEALRQQENRIGTDALKFKDYDEKFVKSFRRYSYVKRGLYVDQIKRWMEVFPREQFLILRSEDLFKDPDRVVNQVFEFLGLPKHHLPAYPKHRSGKYSPVSQEMKDALAEYFRPYNQQLEQFLGRKFYWDTDATTANSFDPVQAKQELDRKLVALSQIPQARIDAEIASWRNWLEFPHSADGSTPRRCNEL